jgi:glutamate synthase domain-containing protein 2
MSFGTLIENAIIALNKGAHKGTFYHDPEEGGLTEFHLQNGTLTWHIGTGYFGFCNGAGNFDAEKFP